MCELCDPIVHLESVEIPVKEIDKVVKIKNHPIEIRHRLWNADLADPNIGDCTVATIDEALAIESIGDSAREILKVAEVQATKNKNGCWVNQTPAKLIMNLVLEAIAAKGLVDAADVMQQAADLIRRLDQ